MKTQIIQLEAHDDALTTRDKMGWSQTSRVVLVWPAHGVLLDRHLDLVLLQRHSRTLGAQLALVTSDPLVRFEARQLGIPVFRNIRQAQKGRWQRLRHSVRPSKPALPIEERARLLDRSTRQTQAQPPAPALRYGFFSLGLLAFLALAGFMLPSAEITLDPATRTQEITIPVRANRTTAQVNFAGILPIRSIEVVVEGRRHAGSSGAVRVPDSPARGTVRFTNLTDRSVTVSEGTLVSTSDARVRLVVQRSGEVYAGAGRTLELPVTAEIPGSQGNLAAGAIQAILGPLGLDLAVSNPAPTRGGSDLTSLAPTDLDRSLLKAQLLAVLEKNAGAEIQSTLEPGDILLSPQPSLVNTLEETYDPPGRQPSQQVSLLLRQTYQVEIISGVDLTSLAAASLDANLPSGYMPVEGTLEILPLKAPVLTGGATNTWQLHAQRLLKSKVDSSQAVSLALGQTRFTASRRLAASLALSSTPEIRLAPAWWPWLPILPFRIEVTIQG